MANKVEKLYEITKNYIKAILEKEGKSFNDEEDYMIDPYREIKNKHDEWWREINESEIEELVQLISIIDTRKEENNEDYTEQSRLFKSRREAIISLINIKNNQVIEKSIKDFKRTVKKLDITTTRISYVALIVAIFSLIVAIISLIEQ